MLQEQSQGVWVSLEDSGPFSTATSGLERIGVIAPPDYRQRISEEFCQVF